ncbi:UBN2 domain-containing protein, partial [Cephalotus follicularis]
NGLNFSEWSEQVQFHLGVLDLDLALSTDNPAALTDTSSTGQRSFHKAWERSNRLSLMFMRMTVANNVKSTIPVIDNAKEFVQSMENLSQSESVDKSRAGTLMGTLTTIKYDGSRTMHEHVTEIVNIAARLRSMGMKVDESFLVQFIINSLPSEYGPFQINYNTIKDKWNVAELQSMLIQEEARLKKQGIHSINLIGQSSGAKRKLGKKYGKGNKGPLNINESSCPNP